MQQYLLDDIKKLRQKWLVTKSNLVWRKKPPEHNFYVTFFTKVGTIIYITLWVQGFKNPPELEKLSNTNPVRQIPKLELRLIQNSNLKVGFC